MSNVLKALARGGSEDTDPDFNSTVLLLHGNGTNGAQNNSFVDGSTNNFTITRNGNVTQGSFGPFSRSSGNLVSAPYDPAVHGGSGYFDGTGDYLSIADAAGLEIGSSQFCIESWIYLDSLPASGSLYAILSKWGALGSRSYIFQVQNNSGTMRFALSYSADGSAATDLFQNAAITAGTWHHVAVTRDSSNNVRFFLDGVAQGSATTVSTTFNNNAQQVEIGRHGSAINLFPGYISNCRLVIGSAVYTSGFTPTGPLTAITNTSLLLNFTNAGIFDNTGKNNLETVGNAQIDTTTKKYGTGSMEFDGTGDYLIQPFSNPDLTLGSGDWTIECWLYVTALPTISNFANIFDQRPGSTSGVYPNIRVTNGGRIEFFVNSVVQIQSNASTINTGVWYFISISKASGSTKMFVDGTQVGSTYTDSNNYLNSRTVIGGSAFTLGAGGLNGFIDDLRITKGVARYTANFTAPTKEFPDL
jgi:hypothetical protein